MANKAEPTLHTLFNSEDADITLCSCDNVLFRVHKANLSAFSVVFKDMFEVGKTAGDAVTEPIQVSEREAVLALLLAMCYPSPEPPIDLAKLEPSVVLDSYEATVKYQIWVAGLALRSFVEPLVDRDPFLVVKLAHKLKDSVLMDKALAETLKHDILGNSKEYSMKAGPLWPRLLEYHYRCRAEVVDVLFRFSTETLPTSRICHVSNIYLAIVVEWKNLNQQQVYRRAATLDTNTMLQCLNKFFNGHPANCTSYDCRSTTEYWNTCKTSVIGFKHQTTF